MKSTCHLAQMPEVYYFLKKAWGPPKNQSFIHSFNRYRYKVYSAPGDSLPKGVMLEVEAEDKMSGAGEGVTGRGGDEGDRGSWGGEAPGDSGQAGRAWVTEATEATEVIRASAEEEWGGEPRKGAGETIALHISHSQSLNC